MYLYRKFSQILVVCFLLSPIPDGISVIWVLYELKFSYNCACVSQGLTTEVPENTKRMHACVTLVLCPELEIDGLVRWVAHCRSVDGGEVPVWK
jgi:hypothetical protein